MSVAFVQRGRPPPTALQIQKVCKEALITSDFLQIYSSSVKLAVLSLKFL